MGIRGSKTWDDIQTWMAAAGTVSAGSYASTGAWSFGPATFTASHAFNGGLVINPSVSAGSIGNLGAMNLMANLYYDTAGSVRAISTNTGYTQLRVLRQNASGSEVFQLFTNYQDAQTAGSGAVTTNDVKIAAATALGTWQFGQLLGPATGGTTVHNIHTFQGNVSEIQLYSARNDAGDGTAQTAISFRRGGGRIWNIQHDINSDQFRINQPSNGDVAVATTAGAWTFGTIANLQHEFQGRKIRIRADAGTSDVEFIFGAASASQNRSRIYSTGSGGDTGGDIRFGTNLVNTEVLSGTISSGAVWTIGHATSTLGSHVIQSAVNGTALNLNNGHASTPFGMAMAFTAAAPNNTTQYFIQCSDTGATRFKVHSNGNVVNTNNSYGAISDITLKENIRNAGGYLDTLMSVAIREFSFVEQHSSEPTDVGVIAQELELVLPQLVETSTEDGIKSVAYSKFVPMLVKALQELKQQFDDYVVAHP